MVNGGGCVCGVVLLGSGEGWWQLPTEKGACLERERGFLIFLPLLVVWLFGWCEENIGENLTKLKSKKNWEGELH